MKTDCNHNQGNNKTTPPIIIYKDKHTPTLDSNAIQHGFWLDILVTDNPTHPPQPPPLLLPQGFRLILQNVLTKT